MVGGVEHVGVAEHQRAAVLGARDQAHGRLEHVHARALGADQRAGHVEAGLGQELVEVVAGLTRRGMSGNSCLTRSATSSRSCLSCS